MAAQSCGLGFHPLLLSRVVQSLPILGFQAVFSKGGAFYYTHTIALTLSSVRIQGFSSICRAMHSSAFNSRKHPSPQKETWSPSTVTSYASPPLAPTDLLPVCGVTVQGCLYECFFCLLSLHTVLKVHRWSPASPYHHQ
jgi:hypothetical protein